MNSSSLDASYLHKLICQGLKTYYRKLVSSSVCQETGKSCQKKKKKKKLVKVTPILVNTAVVYEQI